jgi:hypothetical protein
MPCAFHADPYGDDTVDFPLVAYEHFMREEGIDLLEGQLDRLDARQAERLRLDENGQQTTDHVLRPPIDPRITDMVTELGCPQHATTIAHFAKLKFEQLQKYPYRGGWATHLIAPSYPLYF